MQLTSPGRSRQAAGAEDLFAEIVFVCRISASGNARYLRILDFRRLFAQTTVIFLTANDIFFLRHQCREPQ
ncbi:MAG: hypothetical protein BCS36_05870 [Desulfovibrio sp. MES5]|nr:MAG: hypothetical protein BCS36_05870 [Desulfovibrio sp. MES5]